MSSIIPSEWVRTLLLSHVAGLVAAVCSLWNLFNCKGKYQLVADTLMAGSLFHGVIAAASKTPAVVLAYVRPPYTDYICEQVLHKCPAAWKATTTTITKFFVPNSTCYCIRVFQHDRKNVKRSQPVQSRKENVSMPSLGQRMKRPHSLSDLSLQQSSLPRGEKPNNFNILLTHGIFLQLFRFILKKKKKITGCAMKNVWHAIRQRLALLGDSITTDDAGRRKRFSSYLVYIASVAYFDRLKSIAFLRIYNLFVPPRPSFPPSSAATDELLTGNSRSAHRFRWIVIDYGCILLDRNRLSGRMSKRGMGWLNQLLSCSACGIYIHGRPS